MSKGKRLIYEVTIITFTQYWGLQVKVAYVII